MNTIVKEFVDKFYDYGELTTRRVVVTEDGSPAKDLFAIKYRLKPNSVSNFFQKLQIFKYGDQEYAQIAFANYWKRGIEKELIADGIKNPTKEQIKEEMTKSLVALHSIYELIGDDAKIGITKKEQIAGPYADMFANTFLNGEDYRLECLEYGLEELKKVGLADKSLIEEIQNHFNDNDKTQVNLDSTLKAPESNQEKNEAQNKSMKKIKSRSIVVDGFASSYFGETEKSAFVLTIFENGKTENARYYNFTRNEKILTGQLVEFVNNGENKEIVPKCDRPESQALRFDQLADALNQLLDIRDAIEDFDDLIVDVLNGLQLVAFENISIEKKVSPKHSSIFDKSYEFIDNIYKNLKEENLEDQIQEWINLNKTIMESKQLAEKSEKQRIAEKNNFGKDGGMFKTDY